MRSPRHRRSLTAPRLPLAAWVTALAALLAMGPFTLSCLDLSWKEGAPCNQGRCAGQLMCCDGSCRRQCGVDAHPDPNPPDAAPTDGPPADVASDAAPIDGTPGDVASLDAVSVDAVSVDAVPVDAGPGDATPGDTGAGDGTSTVTCPVDPGICFACTPGCSCSCGGAATLCCTNRFGLPQCGGCP